MRKHATIIVLFLVLINAGCRDRDNLPPDPAITPTQMAALQPASSPEPTPIPTLSVQASGTPSAEPENETISYRAEYEGLSVRFEHEAGQNHDRFFLQISRNGQLAYEGGAVPNSEPGWVLSNRLSVPGSPQFYNLDEDPEMEIVLEILEAGTQCCAHTIIADYAPEYNRPYFQYEFTWHSWEPSSIFPSILDLDGDGRMELVGREAGFSSAFGSDENPEAAPIQIWHYSRDGLQDDTRDFPESISQDAGEWWSAYTNANDPAWFGHPAALSALVADQCMLDAQIGEASLDWDRAESIYANSTQGAAQPWVDYLIGLQEALQAHGYACQIELPSLPLVEVRPTPAQPALVSIAFDPLSFSYDPAMLSAINSETIPINPAVPEQLSLPDFQQITMQVNTPCDRPAWMYIIPVEAYIQVNPGVEATLAELRNLLEKKTAPMPPGGEIPHLPRPNAAQIMQANPLFLDMQNGSGLRALLFYTQNLIRPDACSFQYIFQGLTSDGRYFISASIPIYIPVLDEINVRGKFTFNHQDIYTRYIEALVSAQLSQEFFPDLAVLDQMMRSLLIK